MGSAPSKPENGHIHGSGSSQREVPGWRPVASSHGEVQGKRVEDLSQGQVSGRRPAHGEVPGKSRSSGEVSGKRSTKTQHEVDWQKGSCEDYDQQCDICSDQNLPAVGYCRDCGDYLCKQCYNYHQKLKPTRDHVLINFNRSLSREPHTTPPGTVPLNHVKGKKMRWQDATSTYVGNINVRTDEDKDDCWITGIALLPVNSIIVSDYNNMAVKLIDLQRQTVTSRLQLPSSPCDVTVVPNDEVAVTLEYDKTIQFVSTRGGSLSCTRSFKVNGKCCGIDFNSDKLCVSYLEPGKVEILSLQGKVLQCFTTDTLGQPLFKYPEYLNTTRDAIFVSDKSNHSLTKLSHHGEVIASYTDENFKYIRGITTTRDGHILVCHWGRGNGIHVLTFDLSNVCELKVKNVENKPEAVCYIQNNNTLYVTSYNHNAREKDNFIYTYKISC